MGRGGEMGRFATGDLRRVRVFAVTVERSAEPNAMLRTAAVPVIPRPSPLSNMAARTVGATTASSSSHSSSSSSSSPSFLTFAAANFLLELGILSRLLLPDLMRASIAAVAWASAAASAATEEILDPALELCILFDPEDTGELFHFLLSSAQLLLLLSRSSSPSFLPDRFSKEIALAMLSVSAMSSSRSPNRGSLPLLRFGVETDRL
mmetsp:Transcript_1177/g.2590  ORF Transcript_1177/g.2590 Transcript_1177/m.2590 type:complete len:207 (-) Transcript_1177:7-627(-)